MAGDDNSNFSFNFKFANEDDQLHSQKTTQEEVNEVYSQTKTCESEDDSHALDIFFMQGQTEHQNSHTVIPLANKHGPLRHQKNGCTNDQPMKTVKVLLDEPLKNQESLTPIDLSTTDIVPGLYEGGLKVWECSLDLCRYISHNISAMRSDTTTSKQNSFIRQNLKVSLSEQGCILELGCGHGLPGCLLIRESEGNKVFFSDFNPFVLRNVTHKNVLLNLCNENENNSVKTVRLRNIDKRVVFVGGNWMKFSSHLQKEIKSSSSFRDIQKHESNANLKFSSIIPKNSRFDMILASETIYTPQYAKETAMFMLKHLQIESGVGLIATKRYYFGVGGGVDSFRSAAQSILPLPTECQDESKSSHRNSSPSNCKLEMETIEIFDDGKNNIREILLVRCIRTQAN